jgi:hypothetical protein
MYRFVDLAAGGGLTAATVSDLHELRALLVDAKAESEQLRAERDEVCGWIAGGCSPNQYLSQ